MSVFKSGDKVRPKKLPVPAIGNSSQTPILVMGNILTVSEYDDDAENPEISFKEISGAYLASAFKKIDT